MSCHISGRMAGVLPELLLNSGRILLEYTKGNVKNTNILFTTVGFFLNWPLFLNWLPFAKCLLKTYYMYCIVYLLSLQSCFVLLNLNKT